MTTAVRTNLDGQSRKTLASQLDRLDGILDGLDRALTGAVQDAVEQAVKQAVQAVLAEVLTNRELQEQLQQAAQHAPPPEKPQGKPSMANRLWQATTEAVRRTVQKVKQFGRGVGIALVAAGGVLAGIVYAARKKIASVATVVYRGGKRLFGRAITTLAGLMPAFAFDGTNEDRRRGKAILAGPFHTRQQAAAAAESESNPEQNRPPAASMCCQSMRDSDTNGQRVSRPDGLVACIKCNARFCQGPRSDPRPGSTRFLLALPGCPLSRLQASGDEISPDAA
jgi:hypothetical protein